METQSGFFTVHMNAIDITTSVWLHNQTLNSNCTVAPLGAKDHQWKIHGEDVGSPDNLTNVFNFSPETTPKQCSTHHKGRKLCEAKQNSFLVTPWQEQESSHWNNISHIKHWTRISSLQSGLPARNASRKKNIHIQNARQPIKDPFTFIKYGSYAEPSTLYRSASKFCHTIRLSS